MITQNYVACNLNDSFRRDLRVRNSNYSNFVSIETSFSRESNKRPNKYQKDIDIFWEILDKNTCYSRIAFLHDLDEKLMMLKMKKRRISGSQPFVLPATMVVALLPRKLEEFRTGRHPIGRSFIYGYHVTSWTHISNDRY